MQFDLEGNLEKKSHNTTYVIDTNILFAALIKKSVTEKILFSSQIILFAPKELFEEFLSYKEYLLKKTQRSTQDFFDILYRLQQKISVIEVQENFILQALLFTPDKGDTAFFALALQLNIPLWSNDNALKEQKVVPVYATYDLLQE